MNLPKSVQVADINFVRFNPDHGPVPFVKIVDIENPLSCYDFVLEHKAGKPRMPWTWDVMQRAVQSPVKRLLKGEFLDPGVNLPSTAHRKDGGHCNQQCEW